VLLVPVLRDHDLPRGLVHPDEGLLLLGARRGDGPEQRLVAGVVRLLLLVLEVVQEHEEVRDVEQHQAQRHGHKQEQAPPLQEAPHGAAPQRHQPPARSKAGRNGQQ
jgi:hypothetical protein